MCSYKGKSIACFRFTDLMCVIGVVILLVQIVLPALGSARELSRRATCNYNLSRIGIALNAYHDAKGNLPPAAIWTKDHLDEPREVEVGLTHSNWITNILPYLNERGVYSLFNEIKPINDRSNRKYRTSQMGVLKCPSDSYGGKLRPYVRGFETADAANPKTYARGNFAINGGSQARCRFPGHSGMPCASGYRKHNLTHNTSQVWGNGVAGFNKSFSHGDFTNGLSKTVAVDEIRAGIHSSDPRGVWSVGQIGMSITWAHGIYGDAVGPNNPTVASDDIFDCHAVTLALGASRLTSERMGCCDHCTGGNEQAGARSMHPDGVHVLTCDGRVHFVTNDIDPNIWHVMHSRENPQDFPWP